MKTTVDLPETLLADVRETAERKGWTVRVVFEESLRAFISRQAEEANRKPHQLVHTVVQGTNFPGMSFSEMLDATAPNRLADTGHSE